MPRGVLAVLLSNILRQQTEGLHFCNKKTAHFLFVRNSPKDFPLKNRMGRRCRRFRQARRRLRGATRGVGRHRPHGNRVSRYELVAQPVLWQLSVSYGGLVGMAMGACGLVIISLLVGPRMAGVVLGLSFIVHQIGSASGPMIASIAFAQTGNYDAFMAAMAVILAASGLIVYNSNNTDAARRERLLAASPSA